jgi:hypothetical protein
MSSSFSEDQDAPSGCDAILTLNEARDEREECTGGNCR